MAERAATSVRAKLLSMSRGCGMIAHAYCVGHALRKYRGLASLSWLVHGLELRLTLDSASSTIV